jgi:hypothetical protein
MLIVLCPHACEVQGVYLAFGYMHTHGYQEALKTFFLDAHMETAPASFNVFACRTREDVHEYDYVASGYSSTTSAVLCVATTRHMAAQALPRLRLAARLLVVCIGSALLCPVTASRIVRIAPALLQLCRASGRADFPLDFSLVGRTSSRCAPGHCVLRLDYSSSGLHRLYCACAVHPDASSRRSTSFQSVTLALVVRPVTVPRCSTTRRPGCTGSTAPVSCIRTRHLGARLLFGRLHWLSFCTRSLCLAARLLIVRIALALLRLCRASGRADFPLNFSLAGRTCSRCAPGHCVSRLDYLSSGLHRLYCACVVHPDASSRRSTSFQSVALALAVRREYSSPSCSGSTPPRAGSSSTTLPRAGSSSSTSPTPRVRVPRHVVRLVTRLVAPHVVDYSASRRLVVDYFTYAARPGASAHHAPCHAARCAARRRLLRLVQARRRLLRLRYRMDLPGPTTSVGTRTDYSVGPWDYSA